MNRKQALVGLTAVFISTAITIWKLNRLKEGKPWCAKCGKDLIHRYGWYCPKCDLKF